MTEPTLPGQGDSALETAQSLKAAGWSTDFEITARGIEGRDAPIAATELKVWRTYRFEGRSDPEDEVILMAVEHVPSGNRGVIHTAFGVDATAEEAEVYRELAHRPA